MRAAEETARLIKETRESVTVGMAWVEYIEARRSTWGTLHLLDHERALHPGGEKRKRYRNKKTEPGILASLANVRLVDLSPERVTEWAKIEGARRPTSGRKGRRILGTFLNWCAEHPTYKSIITNNAAQNKETKRQLQSRRDVWRSIHKDFGWKSISSDSDCAELVSPTRTISIRNASPIQLRLLYPTRLRPPG